MAKINSRAKGANGELEVAAILQQVVNRVAIHCGYQAPTIRRNVEQCQVGGEDLLGLPWYAIEVKRCERVELAKWWEQACVQAKRKAPGANAWDVLVKGGWKRVGSGAVGTGQVVMGGGPGAAAGAAPVHEEAAGGSHAMGGGSVGLAGGEAACTGTLGGSGLVRFAAGGLDAGEAAGGLRRAAQGLGMPAPTWSRPKGGKGLAALFPPLRGGPVAVDAGEHVADLHRYARGDGNPVSEPVEAVGERVATTPQPNAEKAPTGAREPVLIWRQNRQPWQCRFVGSIVCTNGVKLVSVVDTSLQDWLKVLEQDLAVRLGGYYHPSFSMRSP